jgi:curved DNA-binding protein CbpA
MMNEADQTDYYETLQLSVNADADTIQRVYRLLAQRFHPDNAETGNTERFRQVAEAFRVLSDPERRAQYDATHQHQQQKRWRLVETGAKAETDFEREQATRLTVLEVLYTQRRLEPQSPGVFDLDLERLTGRPREHLEFTVWYLMQKRWVERGDNSRLLITAEGVDYLEKNYQAQASQRLLEARTD